MKVTVRRTPHDDIHVEYEPEDSVLVLKQKIEKVHNISPDAQFLVFAGRALKDDTLMKDLKLNTRSVIVVKSSLDEKTPKTPRKRETPKPIRIIPATDERPAIDTSSEEFKKALAELQEKHKCDEDQATIALRRTAMNIAEAIELLSSGVDLREDHNDLGMRVAVGPIGRGVGGRQPTLPPIDKRGTTIDFVVTDAPNKPTSSKLDSLNFDDPTNGGCLFGDAEGDERVPYCFTETGIALKITTVDRDALTSLIEETKADPFSAVEAYYASDRNVETAKSILES
ncbi:hypothetical protein BLNAU_18707 [Blattamonas nauphoetae]|uniref:Ubiquitin-like domain-containing protein n=1 Tax=Blattamonas nauphoetae TaxID=2049346 RepID=A0ABQ9X6U2_9EUKA|nr:hypothetical protein BLNAU_18707 [Blattamonas nauphoetae]